MRLSHSLGLALVIGWLAGGTPASAADNLALLTSARPE